MSKILLHICCGPCGIYPQEKLRQDGFAVSGFFYNPNIWPEEEYQKRKQAVTDFASMYSLNVICPTYAPEDFLAAIKGRQDRPQRCLACWSLRLKRTAAFAKKNGFDSFSTTLLVSPYQDQEALKKIGDEIAAAQEVKFHYEDLRCGFRKAHEEARAKHLYCQKYCGCDYSRIETCKKSVKH